MPRDGYLLGFDIGSSSVKATLLDIEKGAAVASATSPKQELAIDAPRPGWAEQDPLTWWEHVQKATHEIRQTSGKDLQDVKAIGISYQMHGLVIVDKDLNPLRKSIIWCDSRAVEVGNRAFKDIGEKTCLKHLLNSPGNFTAAKLAWVKEHEPDIFKKVHKMMLPGDFIALKLTGSLTTTPSGLSEGIMWDYLDQAPSKLILDYFGIAPELLPEIRPTFSVQGEISAAAAGLLGLKAGIPVSYRAGDQPNNALSLNVLNPGEIAATAGTSGVVYGVGDKPDYDPQSRVNTFVHVNHTAQAPRYGTLLCLSGTGILNSWIKHNFMTVDGQGMSYERMNQVAAEAPVGSGGISILPYGNGAERTLGNRDIGASIHGMSFNTHSRSHVLRAAQEGIVFALNYGMKIMRDMGITISTVRAGNANMFLSPLFAQAFATVSGARVELYDTDGSQGAARGAGIGAGIYSTYEQAFEKLATIRSIDPDTSQSEQYRNAYERWLGVLNKALA